MGIMPKDTCSKAMTSPIIAQQVCDRPNYIKAERPNILPYRKTMTVPIIVLHRYGPVQATPIMNKGMCNNTVTGQIT